MLIDRTHLGWLIATSCLAGGTALLYFADAPRHPSGPSGDTVVGLFLGGAALALMLFLVALGLKRRVPHWRLGRAGTWMRGHIWMGVLVPWLVALHGAFATGGALTTLLWVLLAIVVISGLLGLILQQFLPSLMLHSIPAETVAQQMKRELASLLVLAEGETDTSGTAVKVLTPGVVLNYAGPRLDQPVPAFDGTEALDRSKVQRLISRNEPVPGSEPIRRFHLEYARPFLQGQTGAVLAKVTRSESMFESLRIATPPHVHPAVNELQALCDRRRQLLRQRHLMHLLMGWLFVHVPLSWALVVLAVIHAVVTLRY